MPVALLARQGDDDAGRLIRAAMDALSVSTDYLEIDPSYTTAESYVISQPSDGERSIIMASGSTSTIDRPAMEGLFSRLLAGAEAAGGSPVQIVTTEVSQVGREACGQGGRWAGRQVGREAGGWEAGGWEAGGWEAGGREAGELGWWVGGIWLSPSRSCPTGPNV